MEDIAPALLQAIREDFLRLLGEIQLSDMTYTGAEEYAETVGAALSKAFKLNISGDKLPEGRMFWNIADRVIRPMLEEDHNLCADTAVIVQRHLNTISGIGLKAHRADLDEDKVAGILNKLAVAKQYEDVAWVLDEPVKLFSLGVVDDTLKKNVDFQHKVGLEPRIIRTAERRCCQWCANLAGIYLYGDIVDDGNGDVFRRHEHCRCRLDFDPGDSIRRQDVWSKRWR